MRSRCSRSIITISAPARPSRMSRATSTPIRSMPRGRSVEGATTRTRAPMVLSRKILERATRECITSPQIAMIEPLDPALVAADGQRIQQRLRRMLMRAVAGIDHGTVNLARQKFHRAGSVVPHHQDVRMHGVQRHRGVHQRLALADRGRGNRHVHDVGAKPFAGQLERGLGAGRCLEEQVDLGAAAQGGALLVDLAVELDIFLGKVEQAGDIGGGKPLDAQQMPVTEDEGRFQCRGH